MIPRILYDIVFVHEHGFLSGVSYLKLLWWNAKQCACTIFIKVVFVAKIYTMGEILVEIMRDTVDVPLGEVGRFLGPYPSGAPAIFISAVAQLGHEAKIWGGVGNDRFGDCLLNRLKADGVECRHISIVDGQATAVAFVAYDSSGDREFIYHIDGTPATSAMFGPNDAVTPDYFHVM